MSAAKVLSDYISLTSVYCHEGVTIAELPCQDYEAFRALPSAIEVDGKVLGRMSWNSDKFYAVYKTSALIGRVL